MIRLLLSTAALLLCSTALLAQETAADPRDVPDPRETRDPRERNDPRDNEELKRPLQREELKGEELLDVLLANDAIPALLDAMRDQAWFLLPYIDKHCEQWLAIVEKGGLEDEDQRAKAEDLLAKAKMLASHADKALRNTRFTLYVETFTSWDEEQQVLFRQGQAQYGLAAQQVENARSNQAALAALTALNRSYDLARPLGDTWGQSMTLTSMGRILLANEQYEAARRNFREAVEVGRVIRDVDSVWVSLTGIYDASIKLKDIDGAMAALRQQHDMALEMHDRVRAEHALDLMVVLNETARDRRGG